MLRNVVSMNPFRMGLKEGVSDLSLGSSDSLLQYWGLFGFSPDSAEVQPRQFESQR
jgi:hypothetical protein